jgi:hypothetical protein
MKKLLILLLVVPTCLFSQKVVPATTSIYSFYKMPNGVYRVITSVDTVDITKDTSAKLTDTIKIVVSCPRVDTAAIQALKICPKTDTTAIINAYILAHPCPPLPKQRTANGLTWDAINKRWSIGYDDGSKTPL